jgi:hypothetical protein
MRRTLLLVCLVLSVMSVQAFAQNGTLTGTVEDVSKALIPGVTITATNTQTGIVTTRISNESGAYDIPGLLPGLYKLSAALPGFQTKTFENIELGNETRRLNFTMEVASVTTNVEVAVDAAAQLTTLGATVGETLTMQKAQELPMVTGDVLDLIRILPGVRLNPLGGEFDTFAGLSAGTVNTTRDGLSVTDGRYANGIFASSLINPELVGEIKLILTPVDAELGRGNGQVQITTRSGTNRYSGSAVWNVRNTALNANSWGNNNDTTVIDGVRQWTPTPLDWNNENQITLSYGGPIIRNKTFFYALYDQQLRNQRSLVTATTLTDTAKRGIFRFWDTWNSGNAGTANPGTGTNANTIAVVDEAGNPVRPYKQQGSADSAGIPYTGELRCVSMFGNVDINDTPLGNNDCLFNGIQGQWVLPTGATIGGPKTVWDQRRPGIDSTGIIRRFLEAAPVANYFFTGDGLNTAGNRYLRGNNANQGGAFGVNTAALQTGTNINADRKQINIKIDQNFNANHKLSGGYTYEIAGGADFLGFWPNQLPGETKRRPHILTTNFTSTLSPSLLNEARFGLRLTTTESNPAWEHSDPNVREEARKFMLQGGAVRWTNTSTQVAATPSDVIIIPGAGAFAFSGDNAPFDSGAAYLGNNNPLYNFADTVRWTRGAHALRFGGDVNITRSNGYNFLPYNIPRVTGGTGNYVAPFDNATGTPGFIPNLQGTALGNMRNMLYLMSGSIGGGNQGYWVDSASDVDFDVPANGHWEDYVSVHRKYRDQRQNEYAAFFQDDWKVTRSFTLNIGARWSYFAVPYLKGGFTSTAVGWGNHLTGVGGTGSGDVYDNWLVPGNLFLTGYGGSALQTQATALQCAPGTQAGIVSNCDPSKLVRLQFVGPDSPNPGLGVYKPNKHDIGPVLGFAWQVPWFGEGKTTIRGGWSLTYGGSGRNGIALDGILGGAPGATNAPNLVIADINDANGQDLYLDLTTLPQIVPIRPTLDPGGTFLVYAKSGTFTAYDQNWKTPSSQNFNLSVTRNLTNRVTLDVRYVATKGRQLSGTQNLNENNIFNNPEMFGEFEKVRVGQESTVLDSMLAGLNLNPGVNGLLSTGAYGAIGTTNANGVLQTAALHLRRWQGSSLALGNYEAVANALNGAGPGNNGAATPGYVAYTGIAQATNGRLLRNGCDRLALGQSIGGAPVGMVRTASGNVPIRCFPENYFTINPQLGTASYINNTGYSNYDSLQTQISLRAWNGMSFTGTHTWSKTLALATSGYTDLRNRAADYGKTGQHLTHDFRANATVELPVGPNKLFFGNTSGWVARLIERWQTSFILNMYTGRPVSVTGQQTMWGGSMPDVVGPFNVRGGSTEWGTIVTNTATGALGGTYFGAQSPFMKVPDPQCAVGGLVDVTDAMGYNLRINNNGVGNAPLELCTLDALASADTGQILLQNAKPGKRGTLGTNTMQTRGVWSFDASASKTFRVTESVNAQIRIDATNALNHPTPPDPTLGINSNTAFGNITGDKTGSRAFRGTLRLSF